MKINLNSLAIGLLVSSLSSTLWANSNVYNATDNKAWIYWQAAGCAGVKSQPSCGESGLSVDIFTVCKKQTLLSGETGDYHFKDGTSNRKVQTWQCSTKGDTADYNIASTGNKGDKKRCAVIAGDTKITKVKCGYSKTAYDTLKSN